MTKTAATKTEADRLAAYRAKLAAIPEAQRLPRACKPDGSLIAAIEADFHRAARA
jgi:hypothetical protein